jgi:hypothetical protein
MKTLKFQAKKQKFTGKKSVHFYFCFRNSGIVFPGKIVSISHDQEVPANSLNRERFEIFSKPFPRKFSNSLKVSSASIDYYGANTSSYGIPLFLISSYTNFNLLLLTKKKMFL